MEVVGIIRSVFTIKGIPIEELGKDTEIISELAKYVSVIPSHKNMSVFISKFPPLEESK